MRTAISLPDDLFEAVEQLAQRSGRARGEIYATALREYIARHLPDEVTAALNAIVERAGSTGDEPFIDEAARRVVANSDW